MYQRVAVKSRSKCWTFRAHLHAFPYIHKISGARRLVYDVHRGWSVYQNSILSRAVYLAVVVSGTGGNVLDPAVCCGQSTRVFDIGFDGLASICERRGNWLCSATHVWLFVVLAAGSRTGFLVVSRFGSNVFHLDKIESWIVAHLNRRSAVVVF